MSLLDRIWDVVVVGAGAAGCAAAIGAARHGSRVLVVEKDGFPGGTTTACGVSVVLSTNGIDLQGIWHDYMRAVRKRGGMYLDEFTWAEGRVQGVVDPESVKYAWRDLLHQSRVDVLYHATVYGVLLSDGAARGLELVACGGRYTVRAKIIIDCTGDGTICNYAGVSWSQGTDGRKAAMAVTKVIRLGNVERPPSSEMEMFSETVTTNWKAAVARNEYKTPIITTGRILNYACRWSWAMPRHRRELLLIMSRVLDVDPTDPESLSFAEQAGADQMWEVADFYKKYVPGCAESYIAESSARIGVRSSRRVEGLSVVTDADALTFAKYSDSIARASWDIDVWPADSYVKAPVDRESIWYKDRQRQLAAGEYFDVRYGCLVTAGVNNLLVAGRCLSAEHLAQASLRIQQTCMATGEAAGVAAAVCVEMRQSPRELDAAEVTSRLLADRRDVKPALDLPALAG